MQIRSLGAQSVNGVPIINNREFNGYVSAKDGQSIIAAAIIYPKRVAYATGLFVAHLYSRTRESEHHGD